VAGFGAAANSESESDTIPIPITDDPIGLQATYLWQSFPQATAAAIEPERREAVAPERRAGLLAV
jgi:hypothetical protein